MGHCYEYSRLDHDFEQGCDCLTTEITPIDASSFRISNCCQMTEVCNETQKCNIGINKARIADANKNEALFLYTRNGVESQVWIVDNDYDNHMIVNGCERVGDDEEHEIFWILSRNREIDEMKTIKINDVLRANHFEEKKNYQAKTWSRYVK
ncbi:hypothetical protein HA402_012887 [Bradysia odoriphaga]|nr:hypothetical protein HA402_012887 [Bradysia odoriphaga]